MTTCVRSSILSLQAVVSFKGSPYLGKNGPGDGLSAPEERGIRDYLSNNFPYFCIETYLVTPH